MKYILAFLYLIPFASFAQQNCTTAYIHFNNVLDSLPITTQIQFRVDSAKSATEKDLGEKKTAYKKKYKDPKIAAKKLKQDQEIANANNLKLKRTWLQKVYMSKISAAQLKIYDKGKKYSSVMNADSPQYADRLPTNSCDETAECLRLVRKALE